MAKQTTITEFKDGTVLRAHNLRIVVRENVNFKDGTGNAIEIHKSHSEKHDKVACLTKHRRGNVHDCMIGLSDDAMQCLAMTIIKEIKRRKEQTT